MNPKPRRSQAAWYDPCRGLASCEGSYTLELSVQLTTSSEPFMAHTTGDHSNRCNLTNISFFADGGKVHLRTGLELCSGKRQAGRETLTTRHLQSDETFMLPVIGNVVACVISKLRGALHYEYIQKST
jgi:hypothetical protein